MKHVVSQFEIGNNRQSELTLPFQGTTRYSDGRPSQASRGQPLSPKPKTLFLDRFELSPCRSPPPPPRQHRPYNLENPIALDSGTYLKP